MYLDISNIEKVQKRYDYIHEIFHSKQEEIEEFIENSKYRFTIKILLRTVLKVETIKKGINVLTGLNDIYSANILMRSLLEHKIVAHYVWMKFEDEESDDCALDYYKDYFNSEKIKQEGYKLKVEGIKNNMPNNNNFENLKSKIELLKNKTQVDLQKIHEKGNQFAVTKIANYLNNSLPSNHPFSPYNKSVIINDLLEYNMLSSFVHGGPYSEMQIFDEYSQESLDYNKRKLRYTPLHVSKIIMQMLFKVLSKENKEYEDLTKKIIEFNKNQKRQ